MNLKNVLRTYGLLRQLTDDETALLNTLRSLNDTERELLVESLGPQKRAVKKAASKGAGKSRRGASIADAIQGTAGAAGKVLEGGVSKMRCTVEKCGTYADDPIHDPTAGYSGYHSFQPARPAAGQSSPNGADGSSTASSATRTEGAGVAVNAGG